jgi:hypothetical protein
LAGDRFGGGAPPRRVGSNSYQGAAYLFARNWGGLDAWDQVIELTAADGGSGDYFGVSVASAGDMVVVGASEHQVTISKFDQSMVFGEHSGSGAAYVFARDWGGVYQWGQAQELSIGSNEEGAQFGDAVAISGNTILGGAPGQVTAGNTDQGAAHVFVPGADVYLPVVVR